MENEISGYVTQIKFTKFVFVDNNRQVGIKSQCFLQEREMIRIRFEEEQIVFRNLLRVEGIKLNKKKL